ncbi:MAG: hypothetical protein JO036_16215 [Candidatus Eremiobacteraeota bacterium]|nr:hypothetical protein [Candidatus Eremiobacteraeota bacterium]
MFVPVTNPEAVAEVAEKTTVLIRATVEYISRLNEIADLTTLTVGAYGFDYAVTVPVNEKLALIRKLSDLTMAIEDEFEVKITTHAVAGPPRRPTRRARASSKRT